MRTMFTLAVIGILSSISFANAAPEPTTPSVPNGGDALVCHFDGNNQNNGLRCEAKFDLCLITGLQGNCNQPSLNGDHRDGFELECNNGFELETDKFATYLHEDTLWVNAADHGKLATIRVKDFKYFRTANDHEDRFRADLLISNTFAAHVEGFCKFEKHAPALN